MELPPEQARYLASNAYSIAQAHYYTDWKPWAIYCDDAPAGFLLYDVTGNDEPGHYAIYRLMVTVARTRASGGGR